MKALVLFHSVTANTYLIAKEYASYLKELGIPADLFRVPDPMMDEQGALSPGCYGEYREEILSVPAMIRIHDVENYDLVFMGCPTYYGTVSGPMKLLLEQNYTLWTDTSTQGKLFGSFTSLGEATGGSETCLESLNIWAMHRSMVVLSTPAPLNGSTQPALGIAYNTRQDPANRPGRDFFRDVHFYLDWAAGIAKRYCGE